jgi:YD repeat-containing protein
VVTTPPSTTAVQWVYTYDLSGNLIYKATQGTVYQYNWDEDNRLLSVYSGNTTTGYDTGTCGSADYDQFSGTALVSYTYDAFGRMITRTDGSGTTAFVWDGMDCVMETDPSGDVTRYYVVNGALGSFDRTVSGVVSSSQTHFDSLGCIRKVTNSSASVVATYDFDAWGQLVGVHVGQHS